MTLLGALVFLLLLLYAAQVLTGLYARSVVTAAAYDAARAVAGSGAFGDSGGQQATVPAAEATARAQLVGMASHVDFIWQEVDSNQVVLEIRAMAPQFVPLHLAPTDVIDRTVTVRTEDFR